MARRKSKDEPNDASESPSAADDAEGEIAIDDALEGEIVEPDEVVEFETPAPGSAHPLTKRTSSEVAPYDPLQVYMRDVQRYALLTPAEEHALAVRYAESGDVDAAARLVTSNLRLVVKIAYDYRRAYKNLLDLIQEGNIGLMQAVKKYDPYKGVKLSSYAAWWIRAYMLRFILNNWRMVKLGTTQAQRKLFFNLKKEKAKLAAMGVEPTPEELARRMDVSKDDVVQMDRRLSSNELSLDSPIGGGEGGKPVSRVETLDAGLGPIDDLLAEEELSGIMSEKIAEFGKTLSGKEATIFNQRLISEEPRTLQDLGTEFGVSRERVRQLEKRVQDKLKRYLQEELGESFLEA